MYGAPLEAIIKGPLGGAVAETKAPGSGGRGGLEANRVDGFGLFRCDLARIHMTQEANKASKRMTRSIPKAKAKRDGDKQSRFSSSVSVSTSITSSALEAALSICCCDL